MVRTPSTMMPLGRPMPPFALPDPAGRLHRHEDFEESPGLLVAFWCNHCPFVKHIRQEFVTFANDYASRGLAVVAVNANDAEAYPEDSPEAMAKEAAEWDFPFPYLVDETQEVARSFGAACTPDFFLFDGDRRLAYRGQFDDSRPGSGTEVTGADLRAACDAVLAGAPPAADQKPSLGCNIKWKGEGS